MFHSMVIKMFILWETQVNKRALITFMMFMSLQDPLFHNETTAMLSQKTSICLLCSRCPQVEMAANIAKASFMLMWKCVNDSGHWHVNHLLWNTPPNPMSEASVYRLSESEDTMSSWKRETPFHVGRNLNHHEISFLASVLREMW